MLFAKITTNPYGENVTSKAFEVISNIIVNHDKIITVEITADLAKSDAEC